METAIQDRPRMQLEWVLYKDKELVYGWRLSSASKDMLALKFHYFCLTVSLRLVLRLLIGTSNVNMENLSMSTFVTCEYGVGS